MFRERQKISFPVAGKMTFVVPHLDETGCYVPKVEDAVKDLPAPENFKLGTLLKAGVPLEEVNTKLFTGAVSLSQLVKSEAKSEAKLEVKSEAKPEAEPEAKPEESSTNI